LALLFRDCTLAQFSGALGRIMMSVTPTVRDIFSAHYFGEPLVPVGADPTQADNAALVAALDRQAKRAGLDDFSAILDFLEAYPNSPWNAALLTNLGLEYYHAGHYSKCLDAWARAWQLGREATDIRGKALADRAVGELACMHSRLGHMAELDTLLRSVERREFRGSAGERISAARYGLGSMRTRPESSFCCGPLALHRIMLVLNPGDPKADLIRGAASTPQGFSLPELKRLSQQLGLDMQMAFRGKDAAFPMRSVAHLKLDHYAALMRQQDGLYLLEDPTFGNNVWMTRETLEAETSGYFLVPQGPLPYGWRAVVAEEAERVHGRGNVGGPDDGASGPCDPHTPGGSACQDGDDCCRGMAVPRLHLVTVSLNINDEPLGYTPPVGPAVRFIARYHQRPVKQPDNFSYSNLGPNWTFDWLAYIIDKPGIPPDQVTYHVMGGGTRAFTGFDPVTGRYAPQLYDQTRLTRTKTNGYAMLWRDGRRLVFEKPLLSIGAERLVFLTQIIDPFGNSLTLDYDELMRLSSVTDAIGQTTHLDYDPDDRHRIIKVTDPFGRFAEFAYSNGQLASITDVIRMKSAFTYEGGFITALTTPYGVTRFNTEEHGTTRAVETHYPDGTSDRVEFNQSLDLGTNASDPLQTLPVNMKVNNQYLAFRNTYYWSKQAFAYGRGDYTKATIYHWLHTSDLNYAAAIPESVKEPLENRVWYDYAGQDNSVVVGTTGLPAHVGRVLDDGYPQVYAYEYNELGNVTRTIDPLQRTFSYIYADNGIDLMEIRQTGQDQRTGKDQNELLLRKRYRDPTVQADRPPHCPMEQTDAAGQTTVFDYFPRGQMRLRANAKGETTSYEYDDKGFLTAIVGPSLPGGGARTIFTYDTFGRVRTRTDESGYKLAFEYDDVDRPTKVTFPDGTTTAFGYTRLDLTEVKDRAGRVTTMEYNAARQKIKQADPLGRATLFEWCNCGDLPKLTDPMGRTTTWRHDIQGRVKAKEYADGSAITYLYEARSSRLQQRIDEKFQVTRYSYYPDNTLREIAYTKAALPDRTITFAYDFHYRRPTRVEDKVAEVKGKRPRMNGITSYAYVPITRGPTLGAGQLARVDGPQPGHSVGYGYDALGRHNSTTVNGVASSVEFDPAGRITRETNALGLFEHSYDGASPRRKSTTYPNGQTTTFDYFGNAADNLLQRIVHAVGGSPISEFGYGYNAAGLIRGWSQKSGTGTPVAYSLIYDGADQLETANVFKGGTMVRTIGYAYDFAGNRLSERVGGSERRFFYNALNQLTSTDNDVSPDAQYTWDAENRLHSVTTGGRITTFSCDAEGRYIGIRQQEENSHREISNRLLFWCGEEICEERNTRGEVVKRFFPQGMTVQTGTATERFFYTRDHLGSIRELVDDKGNVRARYDYDLYGVRTRVSGDVESDFGFTGHFYHAGLALDLTIFRPYHPKLGRWLSRDPLSDAELTQRNNLYAYVGNNPVNRIDSMGLSDKIPAKDCRTETQPCEPCPRGMTPEVAPDCERRAFYALLRCVFHALFDLNALDGNSYRNAKKCRPIYDKAVAKCPIVCVEKGW
jgi:RHS repeat-associated protein